MEPCRFASPGAGLKRLDPRMLVSSCGANPLARRAQFRSTAQLRVISQFRPMAKPTIVPQSPLLQASIQPRLTRRVFCPQDSLSGNCQTDTLADEPDLVNKGQNPRIEPGRAMAHRVRKRV